MLEYQIGHEERVASKELCLAIKQKNNKKDDLAQNLREPSFLFKGDCQSTLRSLGACFHFRFRFELMRYSSVIAYKASLSSPL